MQGLAELGLNALSRGKRKKTWFEVLALTPGPPPSTAGEYIYKMNSREGIPFYEARATTWLSLIRDDISLYIYAYLYLYDIYIYVCQEDFELDKWLELWHIVIVLCHRSVMIYESVMKTYGRGSSTEKSDNRGRHP